MPRKKKVDNKKLIDMVKGGTAQKDIMKKLGFKTSTQLKVAYANALMEEGKAPEIKSGKKAKASGKGKNEIKVNKRGSLIVPGPLVQAMGFKQGDAFLVRKTKAGVSLKKG
jgi:hypothetical protein